MKSDLSVFFFGDFKFCCSLTKLPRFVSISIPLVTTHRKLSLNCFKQQGKSITFCIKSPKLGQLYSWLIWWLNNIINNPGFSVFLIFIFRKLTWLALLMGTNRGAAPAEGMLARHTICSLESHFESPLQPFPYTTADFPSCLIAQNYITLSCLNQSLVRRMALLQMARLIRVYI